MTPDSRISLSSLGISLFLCALSGVLLALSFPKVSLWFLAWFSMVPFLLAVFASQKSLPLRQTLYLGFAFGFFHFLVGLYWVDIVLEKYGGLPVWMSIPVLIMVLGFSTIACFYRCGCLCRLCGLCLNG
jgi:apolipoprotein N-acyltransferase